MTVAADVLALRAGRMTIEQLAEKLGKATYADPDMPVVPTDAQGVWDRAEDRDRDKPGTWQEVRNAFLSGDLTEEEYLFISETADKYSGVAADGTRETTGTEPADDPDATDPAASTGLKPGAGGDAADEPADGEKPAVPKPPGGAPVTAKPPAEGEPAADAESDTEADKPADEKPVESESAQVTDGEEVDTDGDKPADETDDDEDDKKPGGKPKKGVNPFAKKGK